MKTARGVTLIDTVVGSALILLVFVGIAAAFELSVDVIQNNKARAGAIALADERMEYVRSLSYAGVGTAGGIPSGVIPQNETITLNGIPYNRRTFIEYEDDAGDGLGAADTNGITEDYKSVKIDVSWISRTGTRDIVLITRVTPANGVETNPCPSACGTLTINAVNAAGSPLQNAQVQIVNPSASPAVNLATFTDASGTASFIGAPASSNYQVSVTKTGYSTAQTYSTTAQNANPTPGNLSVTSNKTTAQTFAIDVLGSKTINTWTQILSGAWSDPFSDTTKISTSTNISVGSGIAKLSGSPPYGSYGEMQSVAIAPATLDNWQTLATSFSQPAGTGIVFRIYDGSGHNLIPDAQLPGNAAGFATSTINLSGISTSTYPAITLDAMLSGSGSSTPSVDSYNVSYLYGPQAVPAVAFNLTGAKKIGNGPPVVYKYNQNLSTNSSGTLSIPNMEWDTYTITIVGTSTGYDIASSCNPQPEALSPGQSATTNLYLAAHTSNSLRVEVHAASTGALIPYATVALTKSGFAATTTADYCGQAFFPGLAAATYTYTASKIGNVTASSSSAVSGSTSVVMSLN
jgi:hypothetical protein